MSSMHKNETHTLIVPEWLGDSAVIEHDEAQEITGYTKPSATVEMSLDGTPITTCTAGKSGSWTLTLPPQQAGGPHTLDISSDSEALHISDLFFGDVWVLGGQSNMQLWLGRLLTRFPHVLDQASDTGIRFRHVNEQTVFHAPSHADKHVRANVLPWRVAGRDDLFNESAVGYFFALRLREKNPHMPIGLIETAIGGTPIETWIDERHLRRLGFFPPADEAFSQPGFADQYMKTVQESLANWYQLVDSFDRGLAEKWNDPHYDDTAWPTTLLDQCDFHNPLFETAGTVWLRTNIPLPADLHGCTAVVHCGTLVDQDTMWANGTQIGQTGYRYPPRLYPISATQESLQLTIRLRINGTRIGGFMENEPRYCEIRRADGTTARIDLNNVQWRYQRGMKAPASPSEHFLSRVASACYNGMIAPFAGLKTAGILWYQGESSATQTPENYAQKMILLTQSWRDVFSAHNRPFIEIQLPNITFEAQGWPRLRDEQRRFLALDNTALVTTYDVGENNDLHPLDKQTVGTRAADIALAMQKDPWSQPMGPIVSHAKRSDEGVQIFFTNCADGLRARGALSVQMAINGQWRTYPARISSLSSLFVPLSGDLAVSLPHGTPIRFLWDDAPRVTLVNSRGQLASPFEIRVD